MYLRNSFTYMLEMLEMVHYTTVFKCPSDLSMK